MINFNVQPLRIEYDNGNRPPLNGLKFISGIQLGFSDHSKLYTFLFCSLSSSPMLTYVAVCIHILRYTFLHVRQVGGVVEVGL